MKILVWVLGLLVCSALCTAADPPVITTVAGNGIAGFSGDAGPATSAQINTPGGVPEAQALVQRPGGVALDQAGTLYIADIGNNRVRKVGGDGIIQTVGIVTRQIP